MTRQKKFEEGDLVVLKHDVSFYDYPDVWTFRNRKAGLNFPTDGRQLIANAVKARETVRFVVWRPVAKVGNNILKAGTICVVKSYSNVFMLDCELISKEEMKKLPKDKDKDIVKFADCAMLNNSNRHHLQVIAGDKLIAFLPGAKLFESAADALSRYPKVNVKFEGSFKLENVLPDKMLDSIADKLKSLTNIVDVDNVIRLDITHSDGTIETRQPKRE